MAVTREELQNFLESEDLFDEDELVQRAAVAQFLEDNEVPEDDIQKILGDLDSYARPPDS